MNPFTGAIRVPNAPATTTRLRVALKWGSYPKPCETFDRGEVEDYTINFQTGGATLKKDNFNAYSFTDAQNTEGSFHQTKDIKFNTANDFNSVKVFPNPVTNELSIVLKNYEDTDAKVLFYNSLGLIVKTLFITQTKETLIKTEVGDLPTGQYYMRVVAKGKRDAVQRFSIVR